MEEMAVKKKKSEKFNWEKRTCWEVRACACVCTQCGVGWPSKCLGRWPSSPDPREGLKFPSLKEKALPLGRVYPEVQEVMWPAGPRTWSGPSGCWVSVSDEEGFGIHSARWNHRRAFGTLGTASWLFSFPLSPSFPLFLSLSVELTFIRASHAAQW